MQIMSTYDILKANSLKMFMLLPPATSVIDFQQTKIMLLTYANFNDDEYKKIISWLNGK